MARAAIASANQASLSALPVASRVAVREHEPVDGGADDDVGQRHALGGADDGGNEAHVTTPSSLGGQLRKKNRLVRDW